MKAELKCAVLFLTALSVYFCFRGSVFSEELRNDSRMTDEDSRIQSKDSFKDVMNWQAYDAGYTDGMMTRGYFGGVYDGRYVYYAPCRMMDFHGRVLRYDSEGEFQSGASWEAYDAGSVGGLNTVGYSGAVFDGRYVYFVPFADSGARHARVLRYDIEGVFDAAGSWSSFDAGTVVGLPFSGYNGAVFDGRYIYFAPFGYEPYAHGRVLRYDSLSDFNDSASWRVYDAGMTDGLLTKGFYGAVQDDQYVYFVPFNDGSEFHGRVLRYDRHNAFESAASWEAYDAGSIDGLTTVGYKGACFDGRYIYFAPFREAEICHGRVLRYDTQSPFKLSTSWSVYDAEDTDMLDARGYVGAEFDGRRFIYFIPYECDGAYHARALRYDTEGLFSDSSSWSAFDAGNVDGMTTKGYKYSTFDGRYLYLIPYHNGSSFSGIALRYDTCSVSESIPLLHPIGLIILVFACTGFILGNLSK